MKNKKRWRPWLVLAAMFASGGAWAAHVTPTTIDGNFNGCSDLNVAGLTGGGSSGTAPLDPQTYQLGGGQTITFDYVPDGGKLLNFSATIPMDYIVIKGGEGGYNVYHYNPGETSDTGLHAPLNPNGQPAGVSHVGFCFFPKPTAAKTATATWDRSTTWTLTKSVTPETITMFDGDSHAVEYTVAATPTVTGAFRVAGTITVKDPFDAGWSAVSAIDTIQFNNDATQFSKAWDVGGDLDTMTCTQPVADPDDIILSCSYEFLLSSTDYAFLLAATGGGNGVSVTTTNGSINHVVTANASFAIGAPANSYGDTLAVDDSVLPANPDHTFNTGGTWTYPRTFTCDADEGTKDNLAVGTYSTGANTNGTVQDDASVTVDCETVTATKDATTSYGRTFTWEPDKWVVLSPNDAKVIGSDGCLPNPIADGPYAGSFLCNDAQIRLNPGDAYDTVYKLVADQSFTDGSFAVSGNIKFEWPAGLTPDFPAAPTDTLTFTDGANGTQPVIPSCGAQGATTLECTYQANLPRAFVPGYNEGSIERQRKCYDKNGVASNCNGTVTYTTNQAPLTYGAPTTETGKCVAISDLFNGEAGLNGGVTFGWIVNANACEDFSTFVTGDINPDPSVENSLDIFASWILPAQTGAGNTCQFMVPNVLSLGAGNVDEAAVEVNVPLLCVPQGCTYTQGYWKTHVNYAPKPQFSKKRDATWDLIDGAGTANENAVFYLSGKSYIEVMWTPPKGNAYYNLAHQYIAAVLNKLDGANSSLIDADLAAAHALFTSKAPSNTYWKKYQASVMQLAGKFAQFNEGTLPNGPRHCSVSPSTENAAK